MPYTFIFVFLVYLATSATGQVIQPDTSFTQAARSQAIATYEQTLYSQAHIFEGNEYITHDHRIKIHPFYRLDSLQTGTVFYNGVHYKEVPMLYDIVRDELAIQQPGGGYRIQIRNEHVSAFSLGGYRFSRLVGDSAVGIPTGFYEILYDGRTKALSHRVKTVHEDISSGSYRADYIEKDRFYVLKDGHYHEVKSKRSLLNLFPDQTKNLRKYIRTNKLKFNDTQREMAVTQVTKRYEELTK